MTPQTLSICLSALGLLAILGEVACNDEFITLLLYLPFYGYPMAIAMFISVCSEKPISHAFLAAGSLLYAAWYFCAIQGVFKVLHKPAEEMGYIADILNNVNYVLVGLYALPAMIAVWSAVGWFERRERPGFYKKPRG